MGEAVTREGGVDRRSDAGSQTGDRDRDGDGDPPVSEDGMFEVLANRRRRRVLELLREGDGTATAGDLAERIAAAENDTAVQNLSSYERKRVYVSLYQNHLPVMDDARVIEYAEHRKTVTLLDGAAKLDPYLDGDSASTGRRTVAVAALLTAVVVLLGGSQIGVFEAVPAAGWTLFGALGLVGIPWAQMRRASAD